MKRLSLFLVAAAMGAFVQYWQMYRRLCITRSLPYRMDKTGSLFVMIFKESNP